MININNLSRSFGTLKAVDKISFSIKDSEILGFLGPNGAGKTTTLRMLVGYLQPSSGSIELDGKSIFADPIATSRQIGYLPEQNPLYDDMTVSEALAYLASLRGMKEALFRERREFVVQNCGLADVLHQRIGTLSKGYRQRTGFAQAILHDPRILILDEPTSGLDPNQIMEIRDLIRTLGKEKMVILSSHIMQEVQALCDRVVIINKGRIIVDDLKDNLGNYMDKSAMLYLEVEGEGIDFSEFIVKHPQMEIAVNATDDTHCKLSLNLPADSDVRQELARFVNEKGWLILEMRTEKQSLEQIFHQLTGDSVLTLDEEDPIQETLIEEQP
ncbi:MAG: ABC transporter ATP-binding protein [Candidatus Cloacimonetes bacterium HGW-Cloacimonetes-3]|jgi:ABC-2 type transport system ATP-binding protein|nr:MAG: ABC transporter ATP-binding protein [Candidatus Cloacimonetes bacterium HGW-Cloacimonetes-3]